MSKHFFLAGAWLLYCVLHSIFASTAFKSFISKHAGKKFSGYRLWYTLFAFLTFAAIIIFQLSISSPYLFERTSFTKMAGVLVALPGTSVMLVAIYKYFLRLSGMYWLLHNDTGNVLQRSGLHRYVRHPLYLGTFLFIWGLWLIIPTLSLLISNVIITIYTLIGIRFEEQKLLKEFGDDYRTYQQQVPMIIPKFL